MTDQPTTLDLDALERAARAAAQAHAPFEIKDGPDYAEVIDRNGEKVALTVRPELFKLIEQFPALISDYRALQERVEGAEGANERDRTSIMRHCNSVADAITRRSWLMTSRGSYEWDDDRYRDEFRQAYDEMVEPINRLREIGRDWSNCPTDHEEIMRARSNWQSRVEAAEASNKALLEVLAEARRLLSDCYVQCETYYDESGNLHAPINPATANQIEAFLAKLEGCW